MAYVTTNDWVKTYEDHVTQVNKQKAAIANNPMLGEAMTWDEMQRKYSDVIAGAGNGSGGAVSTLGGWTTDKDAALLAGGTPGTIPGKETPGYYVPRTRPSAESAIAKGTSGADEDLQDDASYAVIQALQGRWDEASKGYAEAMAAGNNDLAAQYKAEMDAAHTDADRIRLARGYQGGEDGSYYMTAGELGLPTGRASGSGSGTEGGSSQEDYLREMYNAQQEAAIAELTAAYEKNVAELDKAGAGIASRYQDARNQTVGASELAARNFNEYAAANGLNSGTGGQAELARNVTLQGNLNSLNQEEAAAFAELDLQRANVEAEYNLAVAQAKSEGKYELAAALYEEGLRQQEQLAAQQQAILEQSAAQQSGLAEYGNLFLKDGVMPSAEMLAAMGLTEADAMAYIAAMGAEKKEETTGSDGPQKPTLTWAQVKAEIEEGNRSAAVLSAYKYYMGEDYSAAGKESTLAEYLNNPAVQTAKRNIDNGIWTGETLLTAIEAAVGYTISEQEAFAILDYAGL